MILRNEKAGIHALLVLLDLTPVSDRVLRRVAHLSLAEGAVVTLLHVLRTERPHPYDRDAARYARQALAEEARQLRMALPRTVRVACVVKVGALLEEVSVLARETEAELVVMGRGGGRAVRDHFVGSTAERVIRRSKLPVLVVRLPARGAYDRPALGLDVDDAAPDVVDFTLRALRPRRPHVPVIHACTSPDEGLTYAGLPRSAVAQRRASCRRRASEVLEELLARSLSKAELPIEAAPRWKLLVRHGSPRTVVGRLARRLRTDLLVLGTHAYSGIAHLLLGTVAGELLRTVACDVLVVPRRLRA